MKDWGARAKRSQDMAYGIWQSSHFLRIKTNLLKQMSDLWVIQVCVLRLDQYMEGEKSGMRK